MIGRKKELQMLEETYTSDTGSLVIVTGREGVGKTTLLKEFSKEKQVFFYQACECSEKEQKSLLKKAWSALYQLDDRNESEAEICYSSLFQDICKNASGKPVIILEDFLWIAKNDENIYKEIVDFLEVQPEAMVILSASTVVWREEEAKIDYRAFVGKITERITIEPFGFLEMVKFFPELSVGDIVQIYAILCGVPGYLKYWKQNLSMEENITELFLNTEGLLTKEPARYLKTNLRELALYNTVLHAMAEGATRLNDIYEATGFSRAKISVYMKNLKQLGVVNKVNTMALRCRDQEVKGMYEITDPLIHFWYHFLSPSQSLLHQLTPKEVYQQEIQDKLGAYTAPYFSKVCGQYLELMNRYQKLPLHYEKTGAWYGKDGEIQLLAKDKDGKLLLLHSKWKEEKFSSSDMENILQYLVKSGIEPDYYYLFSKSDFDEDLKRKAGLVRNMILVDLNDL